MTNNNSPTLPKKLQNNFENVKKTTFLTQKMDKMTLTMFKYTDVNFTKMVDFLVHSRSTSSKIALLAQK